MAVASYFKVQDAGVACQKLQDAGFTGKWVKAGIRFVILSNATLAQAHGVLA